MMKRIILSALMLLMLLSCTEGPFRQETTACFSISASGNWGMPATKSLLADPSIESKVTCVSIGVYSGGNLLTARHFTSAGGTLKLENGDDFTVYALVNMGDMRAAFPAEESALEGVSYRLQSYDAGAGSINSMGIPMAGSASFRGGESTDVDIPVKRLLAKVTANLRTDWPGGKVSRVSVHNMNGVLKPFGKSAISSSGDVYTLSVESALPAVPSSSASLVLYVPENMQGDESGITSSDDKSPQHNPAISSKKDKLTYLQVEAAGSGLYSGSMIYRSYLGNDETGNFDIQRDCAYIWNITYSEDRLSESQWKYDSAALEDLRYLKVVSPVFILPGQAVSLSDFVESNLPVNTIGWSAWIRPSSAREHPIETVLNPDSLEGHSFETVSYLHPDDMANLHVSVFPLNNPRSNLYGEIKMYVADQAISWMHTRKRKYYIYPGRVAYAEPCYSAIYFDEDYDGRESVVIKGKGGTDWFWTESPADGISSEYLGDTGQEYEQIRYSASPAALPGEYNIIAYTKDDARESATLHVNDTRFIKWLDCASSVPSANSNFSSYKLLSDNKIVITLPSGSSYTKRTGSRFLPANTPFRFVAGDRSADIETINPALSGYVFEGKSLLADNWSDRIGISYSSGMTTANMYGTNSKSGYLNLIPGITSDLADDSKFTISIYAKNGYDDATRHTIEARIITGDDRTNYELVVLPAISRVIIGASITFTPVLYEITTHDWTDVRYDMTELSPDNPRLSWNGAAAGVFTATEPGNYRVSCSYRNGLTVGYADIEVISSDVDISGNWDIEGPSILE
ncbi:MAG: DUF4906 domain-containing protein [Bacteroidales bacterium]|nr:DUF4906 domain-containing protein [Bacteroidales bacterium]